MSQGRVSSISKLCRDREIEGMVKYTLMFHFALHFILCEVQARGGRGGGGGCELRLIHKICVN